LAALELKFDLDDLLSALVLERTILVKRRAETTGRDVV
jgi:hypothetical protein